MTTPHNDYRVGLKAEFERRCRRNARYSLRAFARDLGMAYSRVHEVIHYKRGLSTVAAYNITRRLGYTPSETEEFIAKVEATHGRSRLTRELAEKKLELIRSRQDVVELQLDVFEMVANWYHYAILELTSVEGFVSDVNWIAQRLGISTIEADQAIARLTKLGLLETVDGQYKPATHATASTSGIPSEGLKKHHEQLLEKAKDAIYLQSLAERDLSSMTLSINHADLPRAREMIKQFRRDLAIQLEANPKRDSVYALTVQLFRLDQSSDQKKGKPL